MQVNLQTARRTVSRPRKHHYLPKFYLRHFSLDRKSLYQTEKATARSVLGAIDDLAAIRDYHRMDHDKTGDQFQLERKLAEIEDALSGVLQRVLQDGIPDAKHHAGILELVSLLRFRVPPIKSAIEESLRQVVRSTGLILERKGRLPTAAKCEEALQFRHLKIEISNWICLQYMFQLAADPQILRMLLSMHPTLVYGCAGTSFLTCDQPVAVFSPKARPTDPHGVALTHPGTEISVPLSHNVLLLLSWSDKAPLTIEAGPTQVAEYNRRTVVMASSYIFAATREDWLLELVKANSTFSGGIEAPEVLDLGDAFLHKVMFRPVMRREHYGTAV